jgi:hypothetical protein
MDDESFDYEPSNNPTTSEFSSAELTLVATELLTKRRKRKTNHGEFGDYFEKVMRNNVEHFRCKTLIDGTECSKEYKGPATTSAM